MLYRALTNGMLVAAIFSAAFLLAATSESKAEGKVPASFAVKSTIGPSDAPVRTAVYGESDRQQVKFQSAGWRGRAYYRSYYAPYYNYSYYPAPYYTYYYPAPPVYTYVPRRAYYAPGPAYAPYPAYYYGW
jgi:hypothetical protein